VQTELLLGVSADIKLRSVFDHSSRVFGNGRMEATLGPYGSLACVCGPEPKVQLVDSKERFGEIDGI